MDLSQELDFLSETESGLNVCGIKKIIKKLKENEANSLLNIIENTDVPAPRIRNILQKHGFNVGADIIRRHRNKGKGNGCSCL